MILLGSHGILLRIPYRTGTIWLSQFVGQQFNIQVSHHSFLQN
jgi:hypothetical protein